ncbi:MAG: kelch repeat-containing protein, partial [Acidimicrobiales bacterium]
VTVANGDGRSIVSAAGHYRYGEGLFTPTAPCTIFDCGQGSVLLPTGKVLVAVGEGGREAELYDPATGTWSPTGSCADLPGTGGPASCGLSSPMPLIVLSGPSAACGSNCGKVLSSGGFASLAEQDSPASKAAFLYDPATESWRRTADMNVPRVNHSATLLPDGTVLVAGGCQVRRRGCGPSGGLADTTAEIFHPDTETWTMTNPMNAGRAMFPVVFLDPVVGACSDLCGKVLAIGGVSNGAQMETVEAYDPVAGTWSVRAPLGVGRYANPGLQVPGGSVVAIGSYGGERTSSEFLDLATGEWAATGPMARDSDSQGDAVRLPNGKVLSIAGGRDVQLYDGPSHAWTATGPRIHYYAHTQEVLLPPGPASACGTNCGKVLIAGSGDGEESGQLVAELYTPRPRVTGVAPATAAAAGGATVTITGTGLTTVSSARFGDMAGTTLSHDPDSPDTKLTVTVPAHTAGTVDVTVSGPAGRSPITPAGVFTYSSGTTTTPTTTSPTTTVTPPTTGPTTGATTATTLPGGAGQLAGAQGYSLVASDGGVFSFGGTGFFGSTGAIRLNQPIVAMEHTPSGRGYWLVGADGGVFAFGDARFLGSTGGIRLARPIVGMRATPSGSGYRLVASDGGVFAFGDAVFRGSTGALLLNSPVVAMERTASGAGYWLVGADGGVFAFGDAKFLGSTGAIKLAQPIVAAARSGSGSGYLLVGADGGVFAFGDAVFRGSTGGLRLAQPIVGMASTPTGAGYWLCARDGGVFAFGNAQFGGSMGGAALSRPVVGCGTPRP